MVHMLVNYFPGVSIGGQRLDAAQIQAAFEDTYPSTLSGDWNRIGGPLCALTMGWHAGAEFLLFWNWERCLQEIARLDWDTHFDGRRGVLIIQQSHYTVGVPVFPGFVHNLGNIYTSGMETEGKFRPHDRLCWTC